MNIGIITWFSYENYGTKLQAIALQRYLRNLGHNVRLINFVPPEVGTMKFNTESIWDKIKKQPQKYATKYALKKYKGQIEARYQKMKVEVQENCVFTAQVSCEQDYIDICNEFDIIVCGSDQIWNPNWYHKFYYADYDKIKSKRISYAPSMGVNTIKEEQALEIKRSLSHFSAISVRERKGAALLKPLLDREPVVVVDPTLLLDASIWDEMFPVKKISREKYVLTMFLTDNCTHWRAAKKYAKDKGLKHIVIPYCGFSYFQNAKLYVDAGIQDFLNLIRGAEYILTDSFHVTVFSMIYRKQFYTFERFQEDAFSSQNERVRNILEMANVSNRLVPYGAYNILDKKDIDYRSVIKNLNDEIVRSKKFLIETIGELK